jgi:invasion protein IalB
MTTSKHQTALGLMMLLMIITPCRFVLAQTSATTVDAPLGQQYLVESYKDWQRLCIKTDQEQDPCHIYQLINDENDLPLGEITIYKASEPEGISAVATILTPLGTLLTSKLVLTLDDDTTGEYPFSWCDKAGCYVRIALSDDEVYSMKKGRTGTIQIESVSAPGTIVTLSVSLLGFTAAIGDLR